LFFFTCSCCVYNGRRSWGDFSRQLGGVVPCGNDSWLHAMLEEVVVCSNKNDNKNQSGINSTFTSQGWCFFSRFVLEGWQKSWPTSLQEIVRGNHPKTC
jgi:hypothetical protein